MSKRHTHTVWRGKFEDGCPRCIELAKAPAAPTDTPSDLVKRIREGFDAWVGKMNLPAARKGESYRSSVTNWCWEAYYSASVTNADRIEAARQRIVELEKMLATESEVTLKFSQAIDRLERELVEAQDIIERSKIPTP